MSHSGLPVKILYGTLNCNHKQGRKSLRIDLCLAGFHNPENQIEGQKCFLSFKKLAANHGGVPIYRKQETQYSCRAPDKRGVLKIFHRYPKVLKYWDT